MTNSETTKICNKCKVEKPLEEFYKSNMVKSGRENSCKLCRKATRVRKVYEPTIIIIKSCVYCNTEKNISEFWINTSCKSGYDIGCKECRMERKIQYRNNNMDKYREQRKLYDARTAKKHPAKFCAKAMKRHARKLKATPKWANDETIKQIYIKCAEVTKETGIKHNVDHIIPLQGELVTGLHVENNLRIIPAIENYKKHNHFIEDLLLEESLFS